MKRYAEALAATALLGIASTASAVTLDFDALATGTYTEAQFNAMFGATFDNTGGDEFFVDDVVNDPLFPDFSRRNAVLNQPYTTPGNRTRVMFANPTSFVSVTLGDFDEDPDDLFLRAFNAANIEIGMDFFANPAASEAGHTLSVAVADIAYVEFYGVGLNNNSVYWDNLTWEAVPEPMTVSLFGLGLIGLALRSRRRKNL